MSIKQNIYYGRVAKPIGLIQDQLTLINWGFDTNVEPEELTGIHAKYIEHLLWWLDELNRIHQWGFSSFLKYKNSPTGVVFTPTGEDETPPFELAGYQWGSVAFWQAIRQRITDMAPFLFNDHPTNNPFWNSYIVFNHLFIFNSSQATYPSTGLEWHPLDINGIKDYGKIKRETLNELFPRPMKEQMPFWHILHGLKSAAFNSTDTTVDWNQTLANYIAAGWGFTSGGGVVRKMITYQKPGPQSGLTFGSSMATGFTAIYTYLGDKTLREHWGLQSNGNLKSLTQTTTQHISTQITDEYKETLQTGTTFLTRLNPWSHTLHLVYGWIDQDPEIATIPSIGQKIVDDIKAGEAIVLYSRLLDSTHPDPLGYISIDINISVLIDARGPYTDSMLYTALYVGESPTAIEWSSLPHPLPPVPYYTDENAPDISSIYGATAPSLAHSRAGEYALPVDYQWFTPLGRPSTSDNISYAWSAYGLLELDAKVYGPGEFWRYPS